MFNNRTADAVLFVSRGGERLGCVQPGENQDIDEDQHVGAHEWARACPD
ncbi:MAG TPA: hypothetical protein VM677_33995 [Actinokineospora sp.]|nr:hypothetical protein [Actinokineospora sp.]